VKLKNLDAAYRFPSADANGNIIYPYRGTGVTIPTFDEFLEELHDAPFVVEIKENEQLAVDLLLKKLEKYPNMQNKAVISSMFCPLVERVRYNTPYCTGACEFECTNYAMMTLMKVFLFWYGNIEQPQAEIFQMPPFHGAPLDSNEFVENAHAFQQKVHYWVINDKSHMQRLINVNADGFFTDRVDVAVDFFKELKIIQVNESERQKAKYYAPGEAHLELHFCKHFMCHISVFLVTEFQLTFVLLMCVVLYILWKCKPVESKKSKSKIM